VLNGAGKQVNWPLPATSLPGHTDPVFFDYPAARKSKGWTMYEEDIKLRAVFDGEVNTSGPNAAGASEPVTTEFHYNRGGVGASTDTSAGVGPATLDLLTGNYTVSRTDVSIPVPGSESNLEFTRTYESNYRNQKVGSMVLGGMWQPSAPMEQAYQGEAWRELRERHQDAVSAQYDEECEEEEGVGSEVCMVEEAIPAADWIEMLDNEGGEAAFEISGGNYVTPEYMAGYVLTKQGSGASTTFELADPDGVRTLFVKNDVGISGSYRPKSISWQATAKSSRMVYEHPEGTGEYRLAKMIAPAPAGVTCSDSESIKTAGCRTLTFQYFSCSCGGLSRLSSITYYNSSGSEATKQKVAEYAYDANYRLIAAWDPRISPALKETYTYGSGVSYKMMSLTPPGEEPWNFNYYSAIEDTMLEGRLKSISRATLTSPSTATTTIVYQVPLSGSGAPYVMSPATVANWGQTDYPVDATAIFPPTQVPSSPHPTDFSQAAVHYLDPEGYEVNTASPQLPGASGPSISTSEIDSKGNIVRSLSPQNRLTALAAEDTVSRSKELDSHSTFNAEGTRMLESWGPLRKARLESGETKEARTHTTVEYDKGFEQTAEEKAAGAPLPNLPTKETTAATIPGEADKEAQVSETKYDWTLKAPIEAIVDPGSEPEHLNLITKTVYDTSTGLVKEVRQPSNTAGGTAGTTKTVYWTAGTNSEQASCGNKAAWAGLPCVSYPAADPSPAESNLKLPWTWVTKYSSLDQPEEVQEKTNGVLKRTTTITYDTAGRVTKTKQIGVTGESASVPAVEPTYSTTTGAVTAQRFKCESPESCSEFDTQEVKTTYDKLGRPVKYEDADGGKSETAYDLMGRVVLASDGKGTQGLAYDEDSGILVELVDSAAGTFTAEYNADGRMTEQLLPNGLAQQITYDETGTAVALRYQKESYCSSGCTWLQFSQEKSIRDQVMRQESNLTSEEYVYDKAGRLTLAKQTPNLEGCTTRAYAYDKNSNRTSVTTRAPKEGGACDTTSAGTKQSSTYDTADRLIGSGIVYDSLGRMTALPSAYSGGGTLSTNYYVNNQIKSQTQDGLTNTYELDSAGRQRKRTRSGSQSGTEVYHYASGSDMPVWIQEGANWTRNIAALGGALGAVQQSSGDVTLQLADMHGDVVATADTDPTETKLLSTQSFDEFGSPLKSGAAKFGWLGSKGRRTELPSGVIQMGVRSYVPDMGRFISPDPVRGGSANAYDYSNADPVNQFDLSGERPTPTTPAPAAG
jgi:RHS repeat-associated protein